MRVGSPQKTHGCSFWKFPPPLPFWEVLWKSLFWRRTDTRGNASQSVTLPGEPQCPFHISYRMMEASVSRNPSWPTQRTCSSKAFVTHPKWNSKIGLWCRIGHDVALWFGGNVPGFPFVLFWGGLNNTAQAGWAWEGTEWNIPSRMWKKRWPPGHWDQFQALHTCVSCPGGLFAPAALTEYHTLGGLTIRNIFSHSPSGWESKMKASQCWFPLRPLTLVCRRPSSPCVFTWSSRSNPAHPGVSLHVL